MVELVRSGYASGFLELVREAKDDEFRRPNRRDRDMDGGTVSFRFRNGEQENGVALDEAVARVRAAVESRVQV